MNNADLYYGINNLTSGTGAGAGATPRSTLMEEVASTISPLNGQGYPIMPDLCSCSNQYPNVGCETYTNGAYPA